MLIAQTSAASLALSPKVGTRLSMTSSR
jgi:hypothetical protein